MLERSSVQGKKIGALLGGNRGGKKRNGAILRGKKTTKIGQRKR